MAQTHHRNGAHFTQPVRQILSMILVLLLAGGAITLVLPRILPVFEANPYLNGFIFFVFVIGVFACFWQVSQLARSVSWIERFVEGYRDEQRAVPQLLAPLAALLGQRSEATQLGAASARSILDSVATRIDEEREITRYIVNVLIFLGLLGTFYGLATTVPAVVDTIRNLSPQEGEEALAVFNRLMGGLESQLGGMGIAFASSLMGLAGSLIVGLLELFAGHGQNRFYRELEEWLSSFTRVGIAAGEEGTGSGEVMVFLLDQIAGRIDSMAAQATADRAELVNRLGAISESLAAMSPRHDDTAARGTADALMRIALSQEQLLDLLQERSTGEGLDAESRMRLRSIDVQMLRILEEIAVGRQESLAEMRKDIEHMLRVVAQSRPVIPGREEVR
ncbi:biopolymer transporter ExbB [Pontibaca methylaminivorans]|uniref:MotA/TolQ/ExbB proton channel family protein n=1 Tax=Pontibaca methylaminivorans TaxID=515897 RepID=A0A1R3WIU4_9RHOB|nr:biopolymer transporter ExbB [Pontibaca methylaminivorans]SIT77782.1 hypothetical protein SAMN05421849_0816 [Pontibaca methylaminivorans]